MTWLILSVILWGLVHSVMAALIFRAKLTNWLGAKTMRFYRLFFNIFSVITLLPVLWLAKVLPDSTLYSVPKPWLYLMLFGQVLAAIGEVVGLSQTDVWEFAGLRQIISPRVEGESRLVVKGLYKYMRHPLYTFGLLFVWLTPVMTANMLVLYISLTAYTIIGAHFEERKLLREFGEDYAVYKKNTPMLVPKVRIS
ncbi:MAG: isoprenylcysteine carboxylmethyltransferase family protein [Anaerolineae bacterium]|jgi:protein-S-isoprenylcysteine O-methyltransferase Ste14|nr:isoprenylcysteine carboxylmethyltransferase family protein [Anaerolineae bacterium]MBT4458303.1 isoprenylcysteine carboxylmethyltransferase family protein [Anaerolineae bacterium]MBT4841680.1 isoprenylcysteine carboxylmethyltransferase family protein [Anaerolineae bacterium]MBT6061830.1 isoprenylcysteine carboxylmethyltransferase family protein [Anaerolineae bacterium]MBT6322683.1 isoprenylcysteine carboxylmethyltransferase family protein [Anaerolineae bacterium]